MPSPINSFSGSVSIEELAKRKNQTKPDIKIFKKNGPTLNKDSFLKLLVTELSQQDPMKPMNDREFISQMAQFSSLEQMNNVSMSVNKLYKFQANQLVGKTITGTDFIHSKEITGIVDSVFYDGKGEVFLNVKGKRIKLEDITSINQNNDSSKTDVSRETSVDLMRKNVDIKSKENQLNTNDHLDQKKENDL